MGNFYVKTYENVTQKFNEHKLSGPAKFIYLTLNLHLIHNSNASTMTIREIQKYTELGSKKLNKAMRELGLTSDTLNSKDDLIKVSGTPKRRVYELQFSFKGLIEKQNQNLQTPQRSKPVTKKVTNVVTKNVTNAVTSTNDTNKNIYNINSLTTTTTLKPSGGCSEIFSKSKRALVEKYTMLQETLRKTPIRNRALYMKATYKNSEEWDGWDDLEKNVREMQFELDQIKQKQKDREEAKQVKQETRKIVQNANDEFQMLCEAVPQKILSELKSRAIQLLDEDCPAIMKGRHLQNVVNQKVLSLYKQQSFANIST